MKRTLKVVADKRFITSLEYICLRLVGQASWVNSGSLSEIEDGVCEVVCRSDEDISCFLDVLSDVIVNDCKAYFIKKSIQLANVDEVGRYVFVRTLCAFDYETDKIIAEDLILKAEIFSGKNKSFLLGSFYDFCLDILKKRWSEVCMLTNENISCLACKCNFDELLKFMIANVESRCHEVFLVERGNGVEVLDKSLQKIGGVYVDPNLSNEVQVLETLITLAPRKIVFLGEDCKLFDRVRNLFADNCVTVTSDIMPKIIL
ncbi:MAG: putative sporulation protein YtxC [Firmicutes bacterium]|nr:putative sporulation protein YtxC [Bacillota bacterium]